MCVVGGSEVHVCPRGSMQMMKRRKYRALGSSTRDWCGTGFEVVNGDIMATIRELGSEPGEC